MSKKISPQTMRTIFSVIGILCYATGYVFFPEKGYGGSFSSLITIAGMFFILSSFTYKTKESELKLHSFIQKGTNNFSDKAFMILSLMFIAFFIVIAYLIYSKILKQEYVGRGDYIVSLCAGFLLLFGFSMWEKWRLLLKIWTNIPISRWLLLLPVCLRVNCLNHYSQVLLQSTVVNSRLAIGTPLHELVYATL